MNVKPNALLKLLHIGKSKEVGGYGSRTHCSDRPGNGSYFSQVTELICWELSTRKVISDEVELLVF